MKSAILFIEDIDCGEFFYHFDEFILNSINNEVKEIHLSDYDDGDKFTFHADDLNGNLLIKGIGTVNLIPSVTLEASKNDD